MPPASAPADADQIHHSAALLAANQRLLALRQARSIGVARETQADVAPGQHSAIAPLPPHLGWHSDRITAQITRRQAHSERQPSVAAAVASPPSAQPIPSPANAAAPQIRAWPSLLHALLRHARAAAGRIWLLAHHADSAGRGWLPLQTLQDALTVDDSPLRVCGRRRLRQLLAEGEGLFWRRDRDRDGRVRVWLTGTPRVAQALGVTAVDRPVWLPVTALTGPIADVRAHFYAAFHSKRAANGAQDWGNPVARATLRRLTAYSARTQRRYDRRLNVARRSTLAVGPQFTPEGLQQQLWQGRVAFQFVDQRGQQGPPGARYIAWRLPNQYRGCHHHAPRGRQRTINRRLRSLNAPQAAATDLVMQRGRGNGAASNTADSITALFCRAANVAVGLSTTQPRRVADRYWPSPRAGVWYVLEHAGVAKGGGNA